MISVSDSVRNKENSVIQKYRMRDAIFYIVEERIQREVIVQRASIKDIENIQNIVSNPVENLSKRCLR